MSTPRAFLSIKEFGESTGLSRSSVMRLITDGALKTTKLGHRRLIPSSELDRLVGEAS